MIILNLYFKLEDFYLKRVAFFVPEICNCGPLNVVLNIIKYLDFSEIEPYIVALRSNSDAEQYKEQFYPYVDKNKIYYLDIESNSEKYLEEIIYNNKIDCINSHGFYPDKLASMLKGIKIISTVHCMFYRDYPKEYGYIKGFFGAYRHFCFLRKRNINYIVGCSKSVSDYCMEKVNTSNICTINNGVDENIFFSLNNNEKYMRRLKLNLKGGRIFVYSGRFIRRKRVPELLQYFLERAAKDDLLILLGDGPEKKLCEKRFASNNIKFLGQVSDPEKYYQISDFVISNSEAEGYPMSIIEAVSCGCYALLSNIPPHREFIENNPNSANFIEFIGETSIKSQLSSCEIQKLSAKVMSEKYMKLYLS